MVPFFPFICLKLLDELRDSYFIRKIYTNHVRLCTTPSRSVYIVATVTKTNDMRFVEVFGQFTIFVIYTTTMAVLCFMAQNEYMCVSFKFSNGNEYREHILDGHSMVYASIFFLSLCQFVQQANWMHQSGANNFSRI